MGIRATSVLQIWLGDGTNSAFALSFCFCFGGGNTIGLRFLYLAFVTSIKL
jgi:hypothetical protein